MGKRTTRQIPVPPLVQGEEKIRMEELARQLRCPSGEAAAEVGEMMFLSNGGMIFRTIDHLEISPDCKLLEIGFGNGKHLPYLFDKVGGIKYCGADISEAMLHSAQLNNRTLIRRGQVTFQLVDGNGKLPYPEGHFDAFFTVNTLYFWPDVPFQLKEIHRVLDENGQVAIGYIEKSFAEKLPFTQTGFSLYQSEEIENELGAAGFKNVRTHAYTDEAISKDGQKTGRPYWVTLGKK